MHTSIVVVPAGDPVPACGEHVDVQRPLISTLVDEVDGGDRPRCAPRRRRRPPPVRAGCPGPDVVRAVALIGVVVMNYHGYLILRGGAGRRLAVAEDFFDPWTGPLSTRFAATFVLVAGVGVTLLTRRSIGERRRRLGQAADVGADAASCCTASACWFDMIWPGTILPYYGAMFVIGAALFTLRSPLGRGGRVAAPRWPARDCTGGAPQQRLDDDSVRLVARPGRRARSSG